jgi:hypothetical protein
MQDPMAIRAEEGKVLNSSLLAWLKPVKRHDVMALDESLSALAVPLAEVEIACLAGKAAGFLQDGCLLGGS